MVVKSTVSLHQTQFLNETTIGFCVFEVFPGTWDVLKLYMYIIRIYTQFIYTEFVAHLL